MEVLHRKSFPNHHNYSIEWGYATWSKDEPVADKDFSIRNRYEKEDGGFNVRGSSEVPWEDFKQMIQESITEDQFSNQELKNISWNTFKQLIKNIFTK